MALQWRDVNLPKRELLVRPNESMRRFDALAAGCNPVANEGATDHPPMRNDEVSDASKLLVN